jgi:hypothetical protein
LIRLLRQPAFTDREGRPVTRRHIQPKPPDRARDRENCGLAAQLVRAVDNYAKFLGGHTIGPTSSPRRSGSPCSGTQTSRRAQCPPRRSCGRPRLRHRVAAVRSHLNTLAAIPSPIEPAIGLSVIERLEEMRRRVPADPAADCGTHLGAVAPEPRDIRGGTA